MDETLEEVCEALEKLAELVKSQNRNESTLNEQYGWHSPAISPKELSEIPLVLSKQIRAADISEIDKDLADSLEGVPRKLELLKSNTIPQFWGGE